MMKKSLLKISFSILFLSLFLFSSAQDLTSFPELVKINNEYRNQSEAVSEYTTLSIDEDIRTTLNSVRPKNLKLRIPLNENRIFELDLNQFKLVSDDFLLKTSDGDIVDYTPGVFYRGRIIGEEGFATISISANEIMGVISTKRDGNFNFGKLNNSNEYVIFNDKNLLGNSNMVCNTPDNAEINMEDLTIESTNRGLSDCVKLYIEGDNALRINKGGVAQATTYIMDIVSVVATLYDNESINVEISEVMVWTSPDGYSTSSSNTALDQFETNNPSVNGDLAHLFALGGSNLGGLAWVDVLCGGPNYAYSNISAWFSNFPTYSWTIEVVTHEMGHNIGSPHTHSCSWPGGAIDNCYTTEGGCAQGPAPTNGGTIMSYCHLTGSGINFNNGFGNLPGNLIRNKVSNAGCLSACTGGNLSPIADFSFNAGSSCVPSVVQFMDNSSNAPTSWLWTFDGGSPSSSTDQNPIITYNDPGFYDVTLSVSNGGGTDEITELGIIEVIEEPIADFTHIVDEMDVNFTNTSSGGATSYYWSFGDGTNSSTYSPNHTYDSDGIYVVTLLASNDCGSPVVTYNVTISNGPTAGFSVLDTAGCTDFGVAFINNSSANSDEYLWSFEGGTPDTSTSESPTIVYEEGGAFSVELIVTNDQGMDTLIYEDFIHVYDFPEAIIEANVNGPNVVFSAPTYSQTDYTWDFGDTNSSTDQNPSHEYTAEGTFTVLLITNNGVCQDTSEATVDILFTPVVEFTSDTLFGCESLTVQYNNSTAGEGLTFNWTFEGGTPMTSIDENPSIEYDSPGIYDVTLEVTNSSGSTVLVAEEYITVYTLPEVDFSSTIILNLEVDFNNLTENADSYSWDFGDGNMSVDEHPTHTYVEEAIYNITLTAFYPCGEVETTYELNLYAEPVASFKSEITEGCVPFTVNFLDQSSINTNNWAWTFEGGSPSSSTDQNPVIVYETAGEYDVNLVVSNPGGENTLSKLDYIRVLALPISGYNYNTNELVIDFSNTSAHTDSYSWDFGDGNNSEEENPSHTYTEHGVYGVTLIATGPCGSDTTIYQISLKANGTDDNALSAISIYPNPVSDVLVISSNQSAGNQNNILVTLYDIYGRIIVEEYMATEDGISNYKIKMNEIISGSYILKLSDEKSQRVEKIVVY